jgi:hypothetical protein
MSSLRSGVTSFEKLAAKVAKGATFWESGPGALAGQKVINRAEN